MVSVFEKKAGAREGVKRVTGGFRMRLAYFPTIFVWRAKRERHDNGVILFLVEDVADGGVVAGGRARIKEIAEGAEEGRFSAAVLAIEQEVFARITEVDFQALGFVGREGAVAAD